MQSYPKTPDPVSLYRNTPEPNASIIACGKVGRWHHACVDPHASVHKGDVLGEYRVLGLRFEVRAPVDGCVESWLVTPNQRVEYGQPLLSFRPFSRVQ